MTKADFLAEQARREERRRMMPARWKRLLISSQGGSEQVEGCYGQEGLIDGVERIRHSVYTQISLMPLHPQNNSPVIIFTHDICMITPMLGKGSMNAAVREDHRMVSMAIRRSTESLPVPLNWLESYNACRAGRFTVAFAQ